MGRLSSQGHVHGYHVDNLEPVTSQGSFNTQNISNGFVFLIPEKQIDKYLPTQKSMSTVSWAKPPEG